MTYWNWNLLFQLTCIIIRQNSTSLSNYSTNFLSLLTDFYNWQELESFNVRLSRRQDVSFDSYNGYYYDIYCQSRSSSVNWHFPLISQCASSKNVIFSRFNSINFLIKCAFYVVSVFRRYRH